MSAHRKPGPAVLGPACYGEHRAALDIRQVIARDYFAITNPNCIAEEQQREADRVAGEEMRLRSERFNRVIRGFSRSARDFQAPTTGGGS